MPVHHRVAVLIDAENVSGDFAASVLREAGAYGATVMRRAYGDFAQGRGSSWLVAAVPYAIETIQVSSPIKGKNFSDMRMTIDAVQLMFISKVDVFCLVSSDGDFTPLAIYLRGAGKVVVGIGTKRASASFHQSCDAFHIVGPHSIIQAPIATTLKPQMKPAGKSGKEQGLLSLLSKAFKSLDADKADGWVSLSVLGIALRETDSNFTSKSYGSAGLKKLLVQQPSLELRRYGQVDEVRVSPGITDIPALEGAAINGFPTSLFK
ncbi:NYN domain-containing protein [Pararhizobium sp. YC-54]|uniref:NYN domain-containing protein n=1 Tax=Pararhizobium sp. YC-54 TaxID=2986920 RepID=UPI0021F72073|nr:NYN domain-containing protein [Pararhizobium sp. YC-54]MCV9996823.1 NYN domain-containing protein [Pararhizobium sp. YC-54]